MQIKAYPENDLEHIYFLILKTNPYDKKKQEKLNLIAKPNVGYAKINASYSPIGNVSYEFEREEEPILNQFYKQKIKQLNNILHKT